MYVNLGIASNVGELIDILKMIPSDTEITAAGGDCYSIYNAKTKQLVLDEKDYSSAWNENVCGTCQYYDEWKNGYCSKLSAIVEPEDYCCEKYELNTDEKEN